MELLLSMYPFKTMDIISLKDYGFYDDITYIKLCAMILANPQMDNIQINFNSIQYIQTSPRGKYLAVADAPGEKINLYSLRSYKARKCLWRGYGNVKIVSIFFDKDNNYVGIYSSQKTLHIYPIFDARLSNRQSIVGRKSIRRNTNSNLNSSNLNNTINNEEDEEQMQANKGKNKPSKFGSLKDKLS